MRSLLPIYLAPPARNFLERHWPSAAIIRTSVANRMGELTSEKKAEEGFG